MVQYFRTETTSLFFSFSSIIFWLNQWANSDWKRHHLQHAGFTLQAAPLLYSAPVINLSKPYLSLHASSLCSVAVGVGFYGNSETNDGVYQLTYSLYNANHTLGGVDSLVSKHRAPHISVTWWDIVKWLCYTSHTHKHTYTSQSPCINSVASCF